MQPKKAYEFRDSLPVWEERTFPMHKMPPCPPDWKLYEWHKHVIDKFKQMQREHYEKIYKSCECKLERRHIEEENERNRLAEQRRKDEEERKKKEQEKREKEARAKAERKRIEKENEERRREERRKQKREMERNAEAQVQQMFADDSTSLDITISSDEEETRDDPKKDDNNGEVHSQDDKGLVRDPLQIENGVTDKPTDECENTNENGEYFTTGNGAIVHVKPQEKNNFIGDDLLPRNGVMLENTAGGNSDMMQSIPTLIKQEVECKNGNAHEDLQVDVDNIYFFSVTNE